MTPEHASQRPARSAPGTFTASLRIFDLSLGEMLWSRRTIFMLLVVGAPVLLALLLRALVFLGAPLMEEGHIQAQGQSVRMTGPAIFGLMIWVFYLRFTVPVLGVFYGTSLMADEVEDKTITYLFARPIRRGAVLIGKYLAYLGCTIFVVLPSVMMVYLLVVPMQGSLGGSSIDLLKDLALLAVGLAVYGAAVRLRRRQIQAAAAHRPGVRVRLGTGSPGLPGVPEAVHHRVLPPGHGPARDAERGDREPDPGDIPGKSRA